MTVGHGWEAKLTGEVPILGRLIERLGLIIHIVGDMLYGYPYSMSLIRLTRVAHSR